jgi:membrane associated rhomboid family serine protease
LDKYEKYKFLNALIYPVLFILIIGLIHFLQYVFDLSFVSYGVYPRSFKGLVGIVSSPLIHGDFNHLFNNSIPLLILGTAIFYFYKKVALRISFWIYLMVGIWTWISARESYHIGASGLIYGLFAFLMVSGFLRRNNRLIALSFFVVMVYGSMIWGIFPIKVNISFEGHLWGFVAGIVLAFYYRKQGPQKEVFIWREEDELDDEDDFWNVDANGNRINTNTPNINYIFKPKNKETK